MFNNGVFQWASLTSSNLVRNHLLRTFILLKFGDPPVANCPSVAHRVGSIMKQLCSQQLNAKVRLGSHTTVTN